MNNPSHNSRQGDRCCFGREIVRFLLGQFNRLGFAWLDRLGLGIHLCQRVRSLGQAEFDFFCRAVHSADMQRLAIGAEHKSRGHVRLATDRLQRLERGERPNLDRPVGGGRRQTRATWVDREIGNLILVREPHPFERVDPRFVATDPAPKTNLFVRTAGDYKPAVGCEGGEELFAGRLAKRVQPLAVGGVPEFD